MKGLMKTYIIDYKATIYCIKTKHKDDRVLLYVLQIHILFKKEMILALIAKQLRVSQLRKQTTATLRWYKWLWNFF